jgi:delta 1-pyrroline-5-carboxylate dehydrogenase
MSIMTLDIAVQDSQAHWEEWNALGLEKRLLVLRKAAHEVDHPLVNWLLDQIHTSMAEEIALPGPTGESNCLRWQGRGLVCVAADQASNEPAVAAQIFTALATGNCVVLQSDLKFMHKLHAALINTGVPRSVANLTDAPLSKCAAHTGFSVYAFCGQPTSISELNIALSQRAGCLAQLVEEYDFDHYSHLTTQDYIWRFVTETTVTVNTTAVGGNATLLELGGRTDA